MCIYFLQTLVFIGHIIYICKAVADLPDWPVPCANIKQVYYKWTTKN